jgi:hypothetical protein
VAQLKALLHTASAAPAALAASAAAGLGPLMAGVLGTLPSNSPLSDPPPGAHSQQQNGVVAQRQGSGAFKPTAAARPLAPATLAELPGAASGSGGAQSASPTSGPSVRALTGKQVQAALNLFYEDLQAFAAAVQLEAIPTDGAALFIAGAGPSTARRP